jgi:redox-sensitive bicupin YhaK (pirin superfamily)
MVVTFSRVSRPTKGKPFTVGSHFRASSFRHTQFDPEMNPLLMVDDFYMSEPTFGLHPHSGFSAVTYLFEDSKSPHLNRDSLGNDFPITPGSLHWLVAGKGVMHDEWPGGEDPEVHGLQFFVNLPADLKRIDPYALHLKSSDIPVFETDGSRVRIVTGSFRGHASPVQLPQPFTLLDVFLERDADIELTIEAGHSGWIYLVEGELGLAIGNEHVVLAPGQALNCAGITDHSAAKVTARSPAHFVWMSGAQVEA